MIMKFVIV